MALTILFTKVKSLVLFFVTVVRRALCCFRRRRQSSCDDQLTHVGVVSNQTVNEFEAWTDWNDSQVENRKPESVQEHIEYYRRQQAQAMLEQSMEDTEDQDFFGDMAPKITRQKKLLINTTNPDTNHTQSMSLAPDAVTYFGNELGEWEETSGWEGETLDFDAQEALREKRRLERERRAWEHQQKRSERSNRPSALGAKIST